MLELMCLKTMNFQEARTSHGVYTKQWKSRIFLFVVFSKNYSSSKWYFNEWVRIIVKFGQHIFPIFYNVDPSQVRHQTGQIGDSLAKH